MRCAKYIDPRNIIDLTGDLTSDLNVGAWQEAADEMAARVCPPMPNDKKSELIKAFLDARGFDVVCDGAVIVRVPCCRSEDCRSEETAIIVGRSAAGVKFPSPDAKAVHLIFVVFSLADEPLSSDGIEELRDALRTREFMASVLNAEDPEIVLQLLREEKVGPQAAAKVKAASGDGAGATHKSEIRKFLRDNPLVKDVGFFLDEFKRSSSHSKKFLLMSTSAGAVGGLGAVAFNYLLEHVAGGVASLAGALPHPWLIGLIPALGGLIVGIIKYRAGMTFDSPCATDSMIDAVKEDADVPSHIPFLQILTASITIGSGGSCGRECPTAYIGVGLGAVAARLVHFFRLDKLFNVTLHRRDRRLMGICGAAAGLGAIFRAPVGASIFATEVLYEYGLEVSSLLPAFFSATISYMIFSLFFGYEHIFELGAVWQFGWFDLLFAFLAGTASAAVGWLFVRIFYKVFHISRKLGVPDWTKPAIGGLLEGALIVFVARELWGMGFESIQAAIDGHLAMWTLMLLLVGKMVASSFTVATGGSGGIIAPSLFIGAMLGGILGKCFVWLVPTSTPGGLYVVIGMASLYAAVGKTPFSLPILIMEATRNTSLILPIFIASTIGYAFSGPFKIYESQDPHPGSDAAGGLNVLGESEGDLLEPFSVASVMTASPEVIAEWTPVTGIFKKFKESERLLFPIIGPNKEYRGIISLEHMKGLLMESGEDIDKFVLARDVATDDAPTLRPDDSLRDALVYFRGDPGRTLPVVSKEGALVGVLSRHDVLRLLKTQILARTRVAPSHFGKADWGVA